MSHDVTFRIDDRPKTQSIGDLREAVGWDRDEEACPAALDRYDTTVAAYADAGTLVG